MNDSEREQIRLIATHETSQASRAVKKKLEAVVADHAAKGRLHSGATIKVSVEAMQSIGEPYLDSIAAKIKAVTHGTESFALLSEAVQDFLNECGNSMPGILKMARGSRTVAENDSIGLAGMKLFNQMRADIDARLAILSYEFQKAPGVELSAPKRGETLSPAKMGGRPPSAFWDDLWAAIGTALYVGKLFPKSQADIERAMADWLDANGHSAAPSTIRARARRLWDGIVASEH